MPNVLIVFSITLVLSAADAFVGSGGLFAVKSRIIALFLIAVALVVVAVYHQKKMPREFSHAFGNAGYILIYFALFTVLRLSGAFAPTAYWGEGAKYIIMPIYFFAVFGLTFLLFCFSGARQLFPTIAKISLIVLFLSVWVDVNIPGTFSAHMNRPAGFAIDPNMSARLMVMLTALSVNWQRARAVDFVLLFIGGVGVSLTLSRSGSLGFLTLFMAYLGYHSMLSVRFFRRAALSLSLILPLLAFGVYVFYVSMNATSEGAAWLQQDRVQWFFAYFSGDFQTIGDDSRVHTFQFYVDLVNQNWLWGKGLGFSRDFNYYSNPHNEFLIVWLENGALGFVAAVGIFCLYIFHFTKYADVRGFVVLALLFQDWIFQHNVFENKPLVIIMAVLPLLALDVKKTSATRLSKAELRAEPLVRVSTV